jgi:hypothetical protein
VFAPYQAIVVSGEEAAQVERLRYHLAHGVKEGLVDQVKRWPGVHFAKSILDDLGHSGHVPKELLGALGGDLFLLGQPAEEPERRRGLAP